MLFPCFLSQDDRILRVRRVAQADNIFEPPPAIVPYLQQAGFYGASRLATFDHDASLISALIERWRPETHTFHMTHGECTITLEDVQIQLGLRCDGLPICGHTSWPWFDMCQFLLGVAPPPHLLDGQRLSVSWLTQTFAQLPDDADDHDIRCFARAYIMRLIGGYLMPDRTGARVPLMYLSLLVDLEAAGQYSWGSAVLAHLYREMCNATDYRNKDIGGYLTLLHMLAWDRFPILALDMPLPRSPVGRLSCPTTSRI